MQNIERYGLVALVFLVVTVGAVLIWNHRGKNASQSQERPIELVADASDPATSPGGPEGWQATEPGRAILHAEPTGRALRAAQGSESPDTGAPGALDLGTPGAERSAQAPAATDPAPTAAPGQLGSEPAPSATPPAEKAPAQASQATKRTYVVRGSDTLSEIAERELGTSKRWPEIVAMNPGLDPGRLQKGKTILLPARSGGSPVASSAKSLLAAPAKPKPASTDKAARTYRVASGDSLWKIAARTLGDGNRWKEIADLNPKVNPDRLVAGQMLVLPGGRSSEPLVAAVTRPERSQAASPERKERKVR